MLFLSPFHSPCWFSSNKKSIPSLLTSNISSVPSSTPLPSPLLPLSTNLLNVSLCYINVLTFYISVCVHYGLGFMTVHYGNHDWIIYYDAFHVIIIIMFVCFLSHFCLNCVMNEVYTCIYSVL